jgi:plasmid stabilization system protein ParE
VRIEWSLRALEQAEAAFDYIADDRPQSAAEWLSGLFERVGLLREFPKQGHEVPEARRDDLREVLYDQYRIVYRIEPSRIAVLLVQHGRLPMAEDDLEHLE